MHLADLVDLAGELEDALGRGGLARVHVREDADVSLLGEVVHTVLFVWFVKPLAAFGAYRYSLSGISQCASTERSS